MGGFCVQSNGICFPWNIQGPFGAVGPASSLPAIAFSDISAAGGPADQWDALSTAAKLQILVVVGFLEMWSETSFALKADGQEHYVRGGKPGYFPKLSRSDEAAFPHPVPLNLWDPFGFTSKMTPERKEKALLAEINNGRLAMIGIFGLISASKGLQVPVLDGLGIKPYAGEIMAPFSRPTPTCRTLRTCSRWSVLWATKRAALRPLGHAWRRVSEERTRVRRVLGSQRAARRRPRPQMS